MIQVDAEETGSKNVSVTQEGDMDSGKSELCKGGNDRINLSYRV